MNLSASSYFTKIFATARANARSSKRREKREKKVILYSIRCIRRGLRGKPFSHYPAAGSGSRSVILDEVPASMVM
jgi:hypothetical protein